MEKNRSKEYEILGRIFVNFEILTDQIKWKIHEQMYYLGLDFDEGQTSMNILLAKMDVNEIIEKFRSNHTEIFTKEHFITEKINLFTKCMKTLIEVRNTITHATWLIGYSEFTGTELPTSRGFNYRYGKRGLKTVITELEISKFERLNECIVDLINFIGGIHLSSEKKEIILSEDSKNISEEKLNQINSYFSTFKESSTVL